MKNIKLKLRHLSLSLSLILLCPSVVLAASIDQFEGTYKGDAEFVFEGETERRDMSTTIAATKTGFMLSWTSVSYKDDGNTKAKTYTVEFIPSSRDNIFKSAMTKDPFGNDTPLDPLQGEPFVWARFEGDTLSVFSFFINVVGEYEMQEFHRTLAGAGLDLVFRRVHNGATEKEIRTFLVRVE